MPLVLTRRLQPLRGLVDLAPVVTVVLLLLLFFLLSSSFIQQPGIKVNPPRSEYWSGTPSSRLFVSVTMAPLQMDAGGLPLPRQATLYFDDQIVTVDQFRAALDRLPASHTMPSLILKADKDVPLDLMTTLMNVAFAHHLAVVIATQRPGAP